MCLLSLGENGPILDRRKKLTNGKGLIYILFTKHRVILKAARSDTGNDKGLDQGDREYWVEERFKEKILGCDCVCRDLTLGNKRVT